MTTTRVDIGILDQKDNWLLHPRFFPSKVGGKPAWLNLLDLPQPSDLSCIKCNDPMIFLCQVYAPYEESDDCFHRTIFIFVCRNGECCISNSGENFIVLRCQLPRKNDYYSFEPYEEKENENFLMEKWPKLCYVCGMKAPSHCSKCKNIFYCSRKHQILDWQKDHKQICPQLKDAENVNLKYFAATKSGQSLLFKEWELLVDEEDEEDPSNVDVNQEMDKLRKMMQDKQAGSLHNISENELEQYTQNMPEDKVFNKFSKRIARHPDQVLRYDKGGSPLWITGNPANSLTHIPNCEYCNGERQFEFQIMPQLLNFIDVGIDFKSIDWGVLAIYTCKTSCNLGPAYKKEFLMKQDLTN